MLNTMRSMNSRLMFLAAAATQWLLAAQMGVFAADNPSEGVKITQKSDRVTVEINGELFTEYWFDGKHHPAITTKKSADGEKVTTTNQTKHVYFWPVLGPGGVEMTRSWPMNPEATGEEMDHQHHRSLWFAHGAINGVDFWAENAKAGRIVHGEFLEIKSGKDEGIIRSTCKYIAPDGKTVCTDERVFRVYNRPKNERLFDFEVTIKAPQDREVVLGDTKEGSMAIRVAESMRVVMEKNRPGQGHILLSTGVTDQNAWGKRAEWCDYYGPVGGKIMGMAMFDHPKNPSHPTWWHVRDYGLFAANPFGVHDFEKKPPGTGNLAIAPGKSITLKYRIYIHEGTPQEAKVAERYKAYVESVK